VVLPFALVEVRCPGCGADVSEWAARCPECGAGLNDAEPVRPADQGLRAPAESSASQATRGLGPRGRRRGWGIGLGLLVVVVGVVGVWTLNPSRGGRVGGIVVPDQLRGRLLFFAEPGDTEIVRADGKVVQSLPQVAAVGYPIQPVVTAEHLVVFVHDGQAYRVGADLRGPLVQVGAADRLFPADGGDVGLQVGLSPSEPTFVEYMAADGTVPQHGTTSTQLPTGSTPVVRMPTGLLVLTSQNRLAFFPAGPSISVGPVRRVIGSFYVTVAWDASTGCASDGVSCPLHLTETAQ